MACYRTEQSEQARRELQAAGANGAERGFVSIEEARDARSRL